MKTVAIVTLAIGEHHHSDWKRYCVASWDAYARKHDLDIVVITEPLDRSEIAATRSPAWQKCLVFSQPFAKQYRRLILLDSDIVINSKAPNICEQVPDDKIGGVISASHIHTDLQRVLLERLGRGPNSYRRGIHDWRKDQNSFYQMYALAPLDAGIVQTGVLVAGSLHGDLFRAVYYARYPIETRCYEQIPLSHAILTAGLFHEIDTRFNSVFFESMLVHFPYLTNCATHNYDQLASLCVRTECANNFSLHFAYDRQFMRYSA